VAEVCFWASRVLSTVLLLLISVSAAATVLSHSCPGIEPNFNYNGNDLHLHPTTTTTVGACCDACNTNVECLFFTFNPAAMCDKNSSNIGCCHLKTSKAGRRAKAGVTSGASKNVAPTLPPTPPPTPRPGPPPAGVRNVLWLQADDLRPNLGSAYAKPWMKTPHMDALADRSLVFKRAYVQQQVCSPSRNSYMTGRR
jgi:hypothetical protein